MAEKKTLADAAHKNIIALCEIRDSSVHFYNKSGLFAVRLQEVGSASVRNYAKAAKSWFSVDFSQHNFYLMPLAFVKNHQPSEVILLTKEEKKQSYISEQTAKLHQILEELSLTNSTTKFNQLKTLLEEVDPNRF